MLREIKKNLTQNINETNLSYKVLFKYLVAYQRFIDKSKCYKCLSIFQTHTYLSHDVGTLAFLSFSTMLGW